MDSFLDFTISEKLLQAISDLGFEKPTPVQIESYSVVLSGRDIVGIAQTGTGKTLAYALPLLQQLSFSKELSPRILVLVPTRELVLQTVEMISQIAKYLTIRILGVYGGTNINTQKQAVAEGVDILVATPGRLYDLALSGVLKLKTVKKLVIDEVDVMLDLGFRYQLTNIFELLPERRQNIMFSATMTEEVEALIDETFIYATKISIAVSGTPLENISQNSYQVKNYYTKINLLKYLLANHEFTKVLVFVSSKKIADRIFEDIKESFEKEICVIHSNKSQNYRIRSVEQFDTGRKRILLTTDVMSRGMDLEKISHVISFDTPNYPENYMHRIGRTGRAEQVGTSILFYTENEIEAKKAIENLMNYKIPKLEFPEQVEITDKLSAEERPKHKEINTVKRAKTETHGAAFHEKSEKNKKVNQGGSYKRKLEEKYKKPLTRGDKNMNRRKKG